MGDKAVLFHVWVQAGRIQERIGKRSRGGNWFYRLGQFLGMQEYYRVRSVTVVGEGQGRYSTISLYFCFLEMGSCRWALWLMPVIPALWEAKMGRSRGQEFETRLTNMVKPHLF